MSDATTVEDKPTSPRNQQQTDSSDRSSGQSDNTSASSSRLLDDTRADMATFFKKDALPGSGSLDVNELTFDPIYPAEDVLHDGNGGTSEGSSEGRHGNSDGTTLIDAGGGNRMMIDQQGNQIIESSDGNRIIATKDNDQLIINRDGMRLITRDGEMHFIEKPENDEWRKAFEKFGKGERSGEQMASAQSESTEAEDRTNPNHILNPDGLPQSYTVQEDDTVMDIARRHLGEGASTADVLIHAAQIVARNPSVLFPGGMEPGRRLDIPRHEGTMERRAAERSAEDARLGHSAPPNLEDERRIAEQHADKIPDRADREKYLADMREFERRARAQQPPLSDEEIARTYRETNRLMETERVNTPVTPEDRIRLAQQIMANAANPSDIDQGQHNTCNAATLEERAYTRNPSQAAAMVSSAAIDGYFVAPDGKVIQIDDTSLRPDAESKMPPTDGKRDYAGQLFQLVAINNYWQRQDPPYHYRQVPPEGQDDFGERLVDQNGNEVRDGQGRPIRQPFMHLHKMAETYESLFGEDANNWLIANSRYDGSPEHQVINNEQDLDTKLREMKQNNQFPAVIAVHMGGWHVISVTDYNPDTGEVRVSNQWGSQNDRTMSLHDLYELTYEHPRPQPQPHDGGSRDGGGERSDGKTKEHGDADRQQSDGSGGDGGSRDDGGGGSDGGGKTKEHGDADRQQSDGGGQRSYKTQSYEGENSDESQPWGEGRLFDSNEYRKLFEGRKLDGDSDGVIPEHQSEFERKFGKKGVNPI